MSELKYPLLEIVSLLAFEIPPWDGAGGVDWLELDIPVDDLVESVV